MKDDIKFYNVDENYLQYLRTYDKRVSLKDIRSFIGIIIKFGNKQYCIPLTSKVKTSTGKKRNSQVTTFIKDESNDKIACLLHNNMIPVFDDVLYEIDFEEKNNKTYFIQEYFYIKSNLDRIKDKANIVYSKWKFNDNMFYKQLCCDFNLLEGKCLQYQSIQEQQIALAEVASTKVED